MEDMLEFYKDGEKVYGVAALSVEGRPTIEMSQVEYNAEQTHTLGAIYIVWE